MPGGRYNITPIHTRRVYKDLQNLYHRYLVGHHTHLVFVSVSHIANAEKVIFAAECSRSCKLRRKSYTLLNRQHRACLTGPCWIILWPLPCRLRGSASQVDAWVLVVRPDFHRRLSVKRGLRSCIVATVGETRTVG